MSPIVRIPHSAIVVSSSFWMISSAVLTPGSPMAPSPKLYARPINVPFAPRASALRRSWPDRIPPSIQTSILSPTASRTAGSTCKGDGALSDEEAREYLSEMFLKLRGQFAIHDVEVTGSTFKPMTVTLKEGGA